MDIKGIMDKLNWMEQFLEQRFLPDSDKLFVERITVDEEGLLIYSLYSLKTQGGVIKKGDVFKVLEEFNLPVTDNHGVIIEYVPAYIGRRIKDGKEFLLYKETTKIID